MSLLLQDVRHSYALTEVLGGVGLALSPGRVLALVGQHPARSARCARKHTEADRPAIEQLLDAERNHVR